MTNPDKTAIAVVMDRSGSMYTIREDAENGLRQFIDEQRKQDGFCTIRLTDFDNVVEQVYPSTNIQETRDYTLSPRGGTALLDAMGRTIVDFGRELKNMDERDRPGNVLVVVITDGGENASKEFNRETVFKMIREQEDKYGWKFVFLAANQDAVSVGASYGFQADSSLTFNANSVGTSTAFSAASGYATTYRGGGNAAFTQADRAAAVTP